MKYFAGVIFVLLAFIASFSSAKAEDAQPLPAPSPDKAQIVFLKPMGGAWGAFASGIVDVKGSDLEVLGVMHGNVKMIAEVAPGEHRFLAASYGGSAGHFLDANVEAGKRYYVVVRFIFGQGFQLRPVRRTGPSDFNATNPDFPHWLSDTKPAEPKAGEVSAFENNKKMLAKALAVAQRQWDARTAEQRAELTLTPDDSLP